MSTPSVARGVGKFSLGIFTRNVPAKVAALVLAVLVWFTVRRDLNEFQTFRAEVVTQTSEGLMLISQSHTEVKVEFQGPTSLINDIPRDPDRATIFLSVTGDDLGTRGRATTVFTVENGRIRHGYGEKVRIVEVKDGPITLEVAVRGEKTLSLQAPVLTGLPADWEARPEILTPQVRLTGPQDELDRLAVLEPAPVEVSGFLAAEQANEVSKTPALRIRQEEVDHLISLATGEQMRIEFVFRRSLADRDIAMPFLVQTSEQDWPVTMVPSETDVVTKTENGGFSIRINFTGLPSELDRVEAGIKRGEIWAYVRAMDFAPYREKKPGESGPLKPFLRVPQEFWGKVKFKPPDRSDVFVQTTER